MMKVIRFTENKIVIPNHKMITEELGVPKGIVEVAENLCEEIIDAMSSFTEREDKYPIELFVDYNISDLNIKKVNIEISMVKSDQMTDDDFEIIQYSVLLRTRRTGKEKMDIVTDLTSPTIVIRIGTSKNYKLSNLVEFIKSKKNDLISSITHELMHIYESFKYPYSNARKKAEYKAYQNIFFGIKPIDDFLYLLYFVHSIENVVRPSELSADIKLNKVSQKNFLEFLENYETYKNLNMARRFSYDGLKKELKNYIPQIDDLGEHIGESFGETDEEKIDEVLRLLWVNITNEKGEKYMEMMSTNSLSQIFGLPSQNSKVTKKYIRKLVKYNNAIDFFTDMEKNLKFVSDKMIRKISKLYAMTPTNESIVNWELYHKTKGNIKKIVTELKYKK